MKRVLIVTYHYDDADSVGSLRTKGIAKYLRDYGWSPVVLTCQRDSAVHIDDVDVIRTTHESLDAIWKRKFGVTSHVSSASCQVDTAGSNQRKVPSFMVRLWDEIVAFPDSARNWRDDAVRATRIYAEQRRLDAVISSSPPATSHLIASKISSDLGIPWIADFRDLWTQNHNYTFSRIRRVVERVLEKQVIGNASVLTTVSKPLGEKLMRIHGSGRVRVITNGFDPQEFEESAPIVDNNFSITYTGFIYRGKQNLGMFLDSIERLTARSEIDRKKVKVNLYGRNGDWLVQEVELRGMGDIVSVYGPVSRRDALKEQRRSQLLLLLTWEDPREPGILTGKLFDYLGSRRPIISVGLYGRDTACILDATRSGMHADTPDALDQALTSAWAHYSNKGLVPYQGLAREIDKYSLIRTAERFSSILDELTKSE